MFFNKKTNQKGRGPAPAPALSPRFARLVRESIWFFVVALAAYVALTLATYSPQDPSWSFSGAGQPVANRGGTLGAWIADLLLYLFGQSAWWFVVAGVAIVVSSFRRIAQPDRESDHPRGLAAAGFAVMLVASAAIEALRFWRTGASLPQGPGGAIGDTLGTMAIAVAGPSGATLLFLALFLGGFSLFSGVSWLALMERIGAGLETLVGWVRRRREEARDRKLGEQATAEREAIVERTRFAEVEREPMIVVAPPPPPPKSERVVKEKQRPLFTEMPDSPLPALSLLEEAAPISDQVSAESLEFTSRLIERKLADFGVAAKVLAAYPGPVITRYEIEPAVGVKGAQIVNLVKDLARALSVVSIRVVETIPGKSCMALELPNPKRQIVRLVEILASSTYHDAPGPPLARARHGHRGQAGRDRPRAHAAPARRRHDRLGQVGRGQRDDPVAALQGRAARRAADPDRPEDAGAVGLRGHPAPARAGRHRHEARAERAQLVRGRDGTALQGDEPARRAQPRRLQPEGDRREEGRASRSATRSPSRPRRRSRSRRCR